ncbi:MAG TPA: glycosyltransferase family 1 protein [Roseiflexaceae bacterium]|nr:glycosyltransferase family 1 protein [Roseiflexaceae bacterium]
MAQSLHIAISARALNLPYGGVRECVEGTIRELLRLGSPHRFTLYYADSRWLGAHPDAQEVYLHAPHKFLWDHAVLPARLARDRPDVVWYPHNVSSLGLRLPSVVTVHDLLYFSVPEFPQREYAWPDTVYMRLMIPYSLRRARRVITVSDWTAHDVKRLLGVPHEKLRTVHHAPGEGFGPQPAAAKRVGEAYGLHRPFFFYAGTLSPRKNVRVLVEALGRLRDELPHDLVLTGGPGYIETPLDDLVARYGLAGRVRRLGLVPRADLAALYSAAEALVFPSRYEGFGIPALEAMACGCPVICSNATSLPEVVADAALTFDPQDVAALAGHMRAIAGSRALRGRLAAAGLARAGAFSYTRAAREVLAVLEEAVA